MRAAVEQVARVSRGGPLDRRLRVTLNFHPDRLVGGRMVIEGLAEDQVYRSQFETGISNGGLTAHPGGDRWRWEHRIFAGVYDDAPPEERPKYGALDHRRTGVGGAIRFGSCHLRLTEAVLDRTTFCFPDSVLEPEHFGTAERCDLVALADAVQDRPLDDYVEAHVHGRIRLDTDVEAIMLDPCYRGTAVEEVARRAGTMIGWTEGRVLPVSELERHPDFRGPEIVALGRRLAEDDHLTARVIGDAARRGEHDQQELKKLWHLVARFGHPAPRS